MPNVVSTATSVVGRRGVLEREDPVDDRLHAPVVEQRARPRRRTPRSAAAFSSIDRARSTVPCSASRLRHQRHERELDVAARERADDHDAALHRRGREVDVARTSPPTSSTMTSAGPAGVERSAWPSVGGIERVRREHTVVEPEPAAPGRAWSAVRAVPVTVQPNALASCTTAVPTPEPTACTSTCSPGCSPARVRIASCAVMNTSGMPPASTRSRCVGHERAVASRGRRAPRPARRRRRCRRRGHPTASASTPSPSAATSPENSMPRDVGRDARRRGVEAGLLHEVGPVQPGAVHPHEHLARLRVRAPAAPRSRSTRRRGTPLPACAADATPGRCAPDDGRPGSRG